MASTYTTRIRLEKQGDGENANSWGLRLNQNVIDLVDEAVAGYKTIDVTGATSISLTTGNGTDDEARNFGLNFVGTLTADCTVNIPAVEKIYFVNNKTTGDYNVLMKPTGGTAVTVAQSMIAATTGTTIDTLNSFAQDSISGTVSINGDLNVTGTVSATTVTATNIKAAAVTATNIHATTKIHTPALSVTNVSVYNNLQVANDVSVLGNIYLLGANSSITAHSGGFTTVSIRSALRVDNGNVSVNGNLNVTGNASITNLNVQTSLGVTRIAATSINTSAINVADAAGSDTAVANITNEISNSGSPSRILSLAYSDSTVANDAQYVTFLANGVTGTVQGKIESDGSGNVNYETTSDERLKENIVNAPSQWETIKNVNVRSYNWKLTGVNNIGFIAQELNEQIPQCVSEGGEDIDKNPWSIDYGKLTPFLTKGLQEAIEEIEKLKERLSALEENN